MSKDWTQPASLVERFLVDISFKYRYLAEIAL